MFIVSVDMYSDLFQVHWVIWYVQWIIPVSLCQLICAVIYSRSIGSFDMYSELFHVHCVIWYVQWFIPGPLCSLIYKEINSRVIVSYDMYSDSGIHSRFIVAFDM